MILFLLLILSLVDTIHSSKLSLPLTKRNITFLGNVRQRTVPLRVLPLGDSITNGVGSVDGNGYRGTFFRLAERGGPVQMIGSHMAGGGDLPKNETYNDGWDGYTIDAISRKADNALEAKPNLVLLLAGTNNMNNASQASTAPAEIKDLIDKIFVRSPRTVLLTATIPFSTWTGRQALNDQYNAALLGIIDKLAVEGKHIIAVPFNSSVVSANQLVDGLHPDEDAYTNMAIAWVQAVNEAQDRGWFEKPEAGNGYVVPSTAARQRGQALKLDGAIICLYATMLFVILGR